MYYLHPYLSKHSFKEFFSTQLQNMSSILPNVGKIIIQWGKYENFSNIIFSQLIYFTFMLRLGNLTVCSTTI